MSIVKARERDRESTFWYYVIHFSFCSQMLENQLLEDILCKYSSWAGKSPYKEIVLVYTCTGDQDNIMSTVHMLFNPI